MVSPQRVFAQPKRFNSKLAKRGITKRIYVVLLITLILVASVIILTFINSDNNEVFVGVMAGHSNVDELLDFINEVEEYVNLIIVSDLSITVNSTKL